MKRDNRGLSLVELIVVVAIMAILAGITMLSISILSGLSARKCANNLHSALSRTRITTMGKSSDTLEIKVEADGSISTTEILNEGRPDEQTETTQVGKNTVTLFVTVESGGTETETQLMPGNSVKIEFNRSTGALRPVVSGGSDYYTRLRAAQGGKSYSVFLIPPTGKMSVSRDIVAGP